MKSHISSKSLAYLRFLISLDIMSSRFPILPPFIALFFNSSIFSLKQMRLSRVACKVIASSGTTANFLPINTCQLLSPKPLTIPSKPDIPADRAVNLSLVTSPPITKLPPKPLTRLERLSMSLPFSIRRTLWLVVRRQRSNASGISQILCHVLAPGIEILDEASRGNS